MRKKMLPQRKVFSSTNTNSTQTQKAKRPLEKMENRKIQQIWTKRRKRHYLLQGGRLLGKASLYLSTPLLGRATKKKLQRVMVEKMASIAPVRFVKLSCPESRTLKNRAGIWRTLKKFEEPWRNGYIVLYWTGRGWVGLCGGWIKKIQKYSSCLCALRARFKSKWGLERNRFLGCL